MFGQYYTYEETKDLPTLFVSSFIGKGQKYRIRVPDIMDDMSNSLYMVAIATHDMYRNSGVVFAPYIHVILSKPVDHVDVTVTVQKGELSCDSNT